MTWLFTKKRWLIVICAALLLHALAVLMPMLNQSFQSRSVAEDDSLVIMQRQHEFSETEAKEFSRLFGITPISFELEVEAEPEELAEPEVELALLSNMSPRLLAVDEVANVLTARILINHDGQTTLKSIQQNESLHGFMLEQISMHHAAFTLVEQENASQVVPEQLNLKIFTRDN